MRKSVILVALGALLLVPSTASADHGIESAHGGGRTFRVDPEANPASGSTSFSAVDGPSGVRGSYHRFIRLPESDLTIFFRGVPTCLEVVGNTATISGDLVQVPAGATFQRFMVVAVDNGNPDKGQATDVIIERFVGPGSVTDPTTCVTTPTDAVSALTLIRGNVIVHDDV
jgi:hypothetical protein